MYNEAITMKQCKRIYLTYVDGEYDCDTFFPIDELANNYTLTSESMTANYITDIECQYKFVEFVRNGGVFE